MTHYDALIIGAGPTGAVTAKRLLQAGMRVVVLEQGDWPNSSNMRASHSDYEITADHHWPPNPNRNRSSANYPIADDQSDLIALMHNGVGGSSVIYAAQWQRNVPSDFCVKTLDGVGDDWPLTYAELEPFYERVETDFAVSGLRGDPAYPISKNRLLPAPSLTPFARRIARAHNELGWHWWPGSNAIATRAHGNLNPCTQRATCMWGCVEGAKASVDRTHWPQNIARGARLITGARVLRLELNNRGLITGAHYRDREGNSYFQTADVTILGANGIGTPRLLLLSKCRQMPDGLANSSGLVGKRLMMHPFGTVVGIFEEDLGTTHGMWGHQLHCLQFYESDPSRGFIRGAKWGLQPTGGPLAMTRTFPWGADHDLWGDRFHEGIRQRLGRSASWGIIVEDLPMESNRVELDETLVDDDGNATARIIYRRSENSNRMMDFQLERAAESLQAAGARQTIRAPQIRETGWHLLGTCKMGDDPSNSVVDRWGQSHDVPNLFIFDGSIWPTASGMNPTATIAAMALRCTEHLVENRVAKSTPAGVKST